MIKKYFITFNLTVTPDDISWKCYESISKPYEPHMRNIKSTFSRTGHMCFLIDFLKICLFLILTPVPHTNTHHKASEDLKYCTQIARTTFTIFWWWFCQFFNLAADVFKISWNSVSLTLKCTTFPSRFICVHLNNTSFQVKSSLLYCQFFHSTYIQRIEIALLSDPWCIQLTLNTDSRRSNTDQYSLTICTYKLYRYTNEDIVEK